LRERKCRNYKGKARFESAQVRQLEKKKKEKEMIARPCANFS
jgi:hypothetical protein